MAPNRIGPPQQPLPQCGNGEDDGQRQKRLSVDDLLYRAVSHPASWSSIWYVLSSYAVISYTENWIYIAFAAAGSWVGAYLTITFLHRPPGGPPVGAAPE
jgi:hypothetical protein